MGNGGGGRGHPVRGVRPREMVMVDGPLGAEVHSYGMEIRARSVGRDKGFPTEGRGGSRSSDLVSNPGCEGFSGEEGWVFANGDEPGERRD